MFWYEHGPGGWGYLFPGLLWLGFWALVVAAVLLLVRGLGRPRPGPGDAPGPPGVGAGPGSSPERLLAERYARGEIDDDEFRRRLDTLRNG